MVLCSPVAYLTLSITWMMNRKRIEAFKLVRRKQDTPLVTSDLCKKILLFIIMCWRDIAYGVIKGKIASKNECMTSEGLRLLL